MSAFSANMPRWLVRGASRPGAPRLFCFPHGGGTAPEYIRWARGLHGLEVSALQLPGRGTRLHEPSFLGMDELVEAIMAQVSFGTGRFSFFGHCLGALIAYEVTRELQALDRPLPERLVLSGFPAPSLTRPRRSLVHVLPDDELVAEVSRRYGGLPDEVLTDPYLRGLIVDYLRADHQVAETYRWRPGPPVPVPITVFGGRDDEVTVDELQAWQRHTTEPVTVQMFPGGHFFLRSHSGPVLRSITSALSASGAVL